MKKIKIVKNNLVNVDFKPFVWFIFIFFIDSYSFSYFLFYYVKNLKFQKPDRVPSRLRKTIRHQRKKSISKKHFFSKMQNYKIQTIRIQFMYLNSIVKHVYWSPFINNMFAFVNFEFICFWICFCKYESWFGGNCKNGRYHNHIWRPHVRN